MNITYINNCSNICFNESNKIIKEEKKCILNCFDDDYYQKEYNNICYRTCPNSTFASLTNEYLCLDYNEENIYMNATSNNTDLKEEESTSLYSDYSKIDNNNISLTSWSSEQFFNGSYNINDKDPLIKDEIIKSLRNDIINGNINLSKINEDAQDLLLKGNDTYYQITTTNNQNNNEYNDISTIKLGQCESILKDIYKINENLPLIIFKVDYFVKGSLIPVIGYEIYHPINNSKLNLSYCKDKIADFNIPVIINEDNLFKYDPNNEYYKDSCLPYTTENGTDILLTDRKDEFINNNMSLCENNCTYDGYNHDTKKALCKCGIKSKEIVISEIIDDKNLLSYNFDSKNSSSNMIAMKCYYTLFSKDGIAQNIGNYILLFMILLFIILGILFYKCGYTILYDKFNELIEGIKNEIKTNNVNINDKKKEKNENLKTNKIKIKKKIIK